MRSSYPRQLTDQTMPELTYAQEVSGVFHVNTQSYHHSAMYWRHEQAKKREYGDRIRKIEAASFALLCVCHHRGHGREATTLYKHLPGQLAAQHNATYSTMAWRRIHMHHIILLHKICSDVHEWQLVPIPPCPKPGMGTFSYKFPVTNFTPLSYSWFLHAKCSLQRTLQLSISKFSQERSTRILTVPS